MGLPGSAYDAVAGGIGSQQTLDNAASALNYAYAGWYNFVNNGTDDGYLSQASYYSMLTVLSAWDDLQQSNGDFGQGIIEDALQAFESGFEYDRDGGS